MDNNFPSIPLDEGLDLRKVVSTGSLLKINEDFFEPESFEYERGDKKPVDVLGDPVKCFKEFKKKLVAVDSDGFVNKKVLEEGGGLPLNAEFTVTFAYSGYWEGDTEPFDVVKQDKAMVVDLKDNGLLPGLQVAISSMLVGEMSVFLFGYQVMYGELGIPPRIKPKADCVFYIQLIKSIITPMEGPINFKEPNMFQRALHEAKLLYSSGVTLHRANNHTLAVQMFKKATNILHKCRLANEEEEIKQISMLKKLYTNMAVSYNILKQPLKACCACNELNSLNSLWNNAKGLFQNAKSLRMIGEFAGAEKRLKQALKLSPGKQEILTELKLVERSRHACDQSKLLIKSNDSVHDLVSNGFKEELDKLITNFKENNDLYKLTLPAELNSSEIEYVRRKCIEENLFFSKLNRNFAMDKEKEMLTNFENIDISLIS